MSDNKLPGQNYTAEERALIREFITVCRDRILEAAKRYPGVPEARMIAGNHLVSWAYEMQMLDGREVDLQPFFADSYFK